jgi:hypothetical protein
LVSHCDDGVGERRGDHDVLLGEVHALKRAAHGRGGGRLLVCRKRRERFAESGGGHAVLRRRGKPHQGRGGVILASGDRFIGTADNLAVARAAFDTAVALWPGSAIELRQKARVISKSG